jgi:hypothetical protein
MLYLARIGKDGCTQAGLISIYIAPQMNIV